MYLELLGGRQHGLVLAEEKTTDENEQAQKAKRKFREPRDYKISAEELAAHAEMVAKLDDPLWAKRKKSGTH